MKKKLLLGVAALFMTLKMSSQCSYSVTANYSSVKVCSPSNITLSGFVSMRPCGGAVDIQLQRFVFPNWQNVVPAIIQHNVTGNYSMQIPSSVGSGAYRILVTNPNQSCGCSTIMSYGSPGTNLSFNSNQHNNSYSFNGTPTFNTGCYSFNFCSGQAITMDNIIMTYPSYFANVNKWRIATSNDNWFTNTVWTNYTTGVPPTSYNILSLLQTNYGATLPAGQYGVQLETYNGCTTVTHFACLNILSDVTFVVGQKYDATNSTNIPKKNSCISPFTNICPSNTAPYSYILSAENTSIPAGQINNSQWSCQLEEYPLNNCTITPVLTFAKPFAALTSMADVSNMDLNVYATTYGGKPANYVQTYGGTKKWKFTINFKYSCNVTYSHVYWLAYNVAGCRIMKDNSVEETTETLSENAVLLFPNPTNSNVEITTSETVKSISVYDVNGKETKVEVSNNKIDMHNFATGIYTLKIYTKNGISTKKVVKQD